MDHLVKKAYGQILQLFSANMIKAFFGFIGTIFVLRNWSASDIGDIYTLVGVMLLFQQFGDLGTGSSFVQLYSRSNRDDIKTIETYLGFKIFVFLALFAFFLIITGYQFFVEPSRELFGLSAITIAAIFGIYGGSLTALTTARQQFTKVSYFKIIPPAVKTGFIIILYYLNQTDFYWLLLAFILPSIVLLILALFITGFPLWKHAFKLKQVFSRRGGQLYQMSKWVFLIGFAQTSFAQLDVFMLKRLSSDVQISHFVSASRIAAIVFMFSQAIFTVMLPKMRSYKSDSELVGFSYHILKLYFVFLVMMIPVTYVASYLMPLLLGQRYVAAVPILQVFVFQAIGHMFINTQSLIFYRKNVLHWLVIFSYIQLGLNFIGNIYAINLYRALGAVWLSTILNNVFYIVGLLFCLYILKKDQKKAGEAPA